MDPRNVVVLGIDSGGGGGITPIQVSPNDGALVVSPPTGAIGVSGLTGVVTLDPFATVGHNINTFDLALMTNAATYGTDSASGSIENVNTNLSGVLPQTTGNALNTNAMLMAKEISTGAFELVSTGDDSIDNDPAVGPTSGDLVTIANLRVWNGASYDRVRGANVFKSVLATASGNSSVWTPASGKSFRLMGYTISVAGTAAATLVELIKLTDGATGTVIAQHQATVTVATPTGDTQIGADLGQGFLSGAANTVLEVNLSAAMATGGVAVNAWGTEE